MSSSDQAWPIAIVFDLDGTLVDSAPDIRGALNRLLAEESLPELDLATVISMVGDGTTKLIERAFASVGSPVPGELLPIRTARMLELYAQHATELTIPYPGVVETLEALAATGRRIGVCTNKAQFLAEQVIAETGLSGLIEVTIGGDGPSGRKPDPRPLIEVARLLGCAPAEALMVGDSENDVAAARAAGVPVALVTYGYCHQEPRSLGPDLLLHGIGELPGRLGQIAREAV